MGFFGDLIRQAEDIARGATLNVAVGAANDATQGAVRDTTGVETSEGASTDEHAAAYFEEILVSEFGDFELRKNVDPSELSGSGRPYDFAFVKNDKIVAVIPLAKHNRINNAAWKDARATAERAGVAFINFHLHMPNQRDFVIDRIKRLLG
jgi:hypothetical protein